MPFKEKLAESKKSDFELTELRGVKFGKDRETVSLRSYMVPRATNFTLPKHSDYAPTGCNLSRKGLLSMRKHAHCQSTNIANNTDRIEYDIENFNNKHAFFTKP